MTTAAIVHIDRERITHSIRGYTPEHDDTHVNGELIAAAICYAVAGAGDAAAILDPTSDLALYLWPFELESFDPSENEKENLIKAGALIAAEIDRVERRDAVRRHAKENSTPARQ